MGRKRTIDRGETLDAIEAVVKEAGFAGLSLEAVARKAGISKASVLYDFQSKSELIAAFIKSRLDDKQAHVACLATARTGPNAWLCAVLEACAETPSEEDMATATVVAAAMGSDPQCRQLMRDRFSEDLCQIRNQAEDEDQALLAWLALNGIMSMEYLGFYRFAPGERRRLICKIGNLINFSPEAKQHPEARE